MLWPVNGRAVILFKSWVASVGANSAATLIGCGPSFVSHICAGRKRPSLRLAARIESLAGIAASAWVTDSTAAPATDPAAASESATAPTPVETPEIAATDTTGVRDAA
jgi:hypothetical protein